jgi:FixJ family two-component response regulator
VGMSQSYRAITAGAAAYLTKPINVTTLKNAVARNLKP